MLTPVIARLTTTVLGPDEPEASSEVVENLVPTFEELPGFRGVIVLTNRETHVVHALTLWESEAALEESGRIMDGLRDAETAGREVTGQETGVYEVSALHLPRH
jgi:heme-degrading monooxygenase HmoA